MVRYELTDTIINGRNKSYPPVNSAIRHSNWSVFLLLFYWEFFADWFHCTLRVPWIRWKVSLVNSTTLIRNWLSVVWCWVYWSSFSRLFMVKDMNLQIQSSTEEINHIHLSARLSGTPLSMEHAWHHSLLPPFPSMRNSSPANKRRKQSHC